MTIQAKADHLLHVARVGGGDEALFAEISIYEAERAAKWAVLARDHYSDEEHGEAADAEHRAFNVLARLPATTLTGLLAKMLIVLEDMGRPGAEYDFANVSCSCEAVIASLIADLSRLGIEWTPRGEPVKWSATVKASAKKAAEGDGDERPRNLLQAGSQLDAHTCLFDQFNAIVLPLLEDLNHEAPTSQSLNALYGAVTIMDHLRGELNGLARSCIEAHKQGCVS